MIAIWLQAAFVAAFVMLVAGVLLWLRAADRKLARLMETAEAIQRSTGEMTAQVCSLVAPAADTIKTIQRQLDGATRLVDAAKRMGESAEQVSATVNRLSAALSEHAIKHMERGGKYRNQIAEALDIAEAGYAAWQFWQSKRKDTRSSACSEQDEGHDTTE
ncbi:DUF948 domain-containing protein [Paenibacillus mendelii]|uniref:DUF948 domain-containing protein n=1 Tax=Paenibacillus mendelii TaxID=206163 RepID=A0ABV6JBA0_9BACL|nr:DUF948 domain-containing protein [Paenibacillus mendelii]MCQ6560802.1 DUF948 domain-containing protein [Paenibacillus mendelii]